MASAENQQLMFRENGLRNDGSHTVGPNDSLKHGGGMDQQDDEIAYASSSYLPHGEFQLIWFSPGTGRRQPAPLPR